MYSDVYDATGFDWDEGNSDKNWRLHQVTDRECEEVFFNLLFVMALDVKHSQRERCYVALGRTDRDRWLFVAFTIRKPLIRVISARDMNQKEAQNYAKHIQRRARFRNGR
jgi:uncharacterized DUF497 family protein